MPFIQLNQSKNEFWADYGYGLFAICMLTVVCGIIICCDNMDCAIIVVEILTVIYCCIWMMVIMQMETFLSKMKHKNLKDRID